MIRASVDPNQAIIKGATILAGMAMKGQDVSNYCVSADSVIIEAYSNGSNVKHKLQNSAQDDAKSQENILSLSQKVMMLEIELEQVKK